MSKLIQLGLAAHEQALVRGTPTPAERDEFSHLPMRRENGIPVFDATRMRPDQVDDTVTRLEQLVTRARAKNVREKVIAYMDAYGRFGLRVQDVCEHVEATKPIVLKVLRELVSSGNVRVKEETTRGTGSKRKRYIWTGNHMVWGREDVYIENDDAEGGTTDLHIRNDFTGTDPPLHNRIHGCAIHALSCPSGCGLCRWTVEQAIIGEAESAERQAGGTGFFAGLDARTDRRLRDEREFAAAIVRGRAARARDSARQGVRDAADAAGDAAGDAGADDGS